VTISDGLALALAAATVGLVVTSIVQIFFMKKHADHLATLAKQTKLVADAAKLSSETAEKALIELERPWLAFSHPEIIVPDVQSQTTVTTVITNYGRSPAFLKSLGSYFSHGSVPTFDGLKADLQKQDTGSIAPGQSIVHRIRARRNLLNPNVDVYLILRVEYSDLFDNAHVSSEVWKHEYPKLVRGDPSTDNVSIHSLNT